MLVFSTTAAAEGLPPSIAAVLPQGTQDPAAAGQWTLTAVLEWLWGAAQSGGSAPLRFAAQAALYLLLASAVALVCPDAGWKRCLDAVAVLGFGAVSLSAMLPLLERVGATAADCQTWLAGFVPVYSGVLALGGQGAGAAAYGGLFWAVSGFLSSAIEQILLPVMRIYFCFAVSAALWAGAGLEQAAELFGSCLRWLLKGCGTVFGLVLGLQSILAGAGDSAAVRMGGSVLAGAVPVVGTAAAAALSGAAAAVQLLKGSLALALVLAMGAAFLPALCSCVLYVLVFSAAGILAAGCGQSQCGRICKLFAEGAKLCGSILTLYFFMVFLSTALLLITGNGGTV